MGQGGRRVEREAWHAVNEVSFWSVPVSGRAWSFVERWTSETTSTCRIEADTGPDDTLLILYRRRNDAYRQRPHCIYPSKHLTIYKSTRHAMKSSMILLPADFDPSPARSLKSRSVRGKVFEAFAEGSKNLASRKRAKRYLDGLELIESRRSRSSYPAPQFSPVPLG